MPRRKEPKIPDAILDQLLAGADPKTTFGPNGLLDEPKRALPDRALNAEIGPSPLEEAGAGNNRNGYGRKTVKRDSGKFELEVSRDRQSSFDPQLIAKYHRRFPGFDDKVISMCARRLSTNEIVAGTDKTNLAVGIARARIRGGARGRFHNVVDLVNKLEAEARAGRQGATSVSVQF